MEKLRELIFFAIFLPFSVKKLRKCGRGDNMNKIKSFENIYHVFPLPCWKKTRIGEKIAAGGKNESCAEYTPLHFRQKMVSGFKYRVNSMKHRNGFAPNFIHSLDSSHMMLTSLYLWRLGINFASGRFNSRL